MGWFGDDSMVGQPIDFDAIQYPGLCDDLPEYCVISGDAYTLLVGGSTRFSVVRTGAADLDLLAAGNLSMESLFGVYTAGSSSTGTSASDPYNLKRALGSNGKVLANAGGNEKLVNADTASLYRAWYPDTGGNLLLKVGGNLTGNITSPALNGVGRPVPSDLGQDSSQRRQLAVASGQRPQWQPGAGHRVVGQLWYLRARHGLPASARTRWLGSRASAPWEEATLTLMWAAMRGFSTRRRSRRTSAPQPRPGPGRRRHRPRCHRWQRPTDRRRRSEPAGRRGAQPGQPDQPRPPQWRPGEHREGMYNSLAAPSVV